MAASRSASALTSFAVSGGRRIALFTVPLDVADLLEIQPHGEYFPILVDCLREPREQGLERDLAHDHARLSLPLGSGDLEHPAVQALVPEHRSRAVPRPVFFLQSADACRRTRTAPWTEAHAPSARAPAPPRRSNPKRMSTGSTATKISTPCGITTRPRPAPSRPRAGAPRRTPARRAPSRAPPPRRGLPPRGARPRGARTLSVAREPAGLETPARPPPRPSDRGSPSTARALRYTSQRSPRSPATPALPPRARPCFAVVPWVQFALPRSLARRGVRAAVTMHRRSAA